jgi:hypothetical protein
MACVLLSRLVLCCTVLRRVCIAVYWIAACFALCCTMLHALEDCL